MATQYEIENQEAARQAVQTSEAAIDALVLALKLMNRCPAINFNETYAATDAIVDAIHAVQKVEQLARKA
jgi:hypothetical protein